MSLMATDKSQGAPTRGPAIAFRRGLRALATPSLSRLHLSSCVTEAVLAQKGPNITGFQSISPKARRLCGTGGGGGSGKGCESGGGGGGGGGGHCAAAGGTWGGGGVQWAVVRAADLVGLEGVVLLGHGGALQRRAGGAEWGVGVLETGVAFLVLDAADHRPICTPHNARCHPPAPSSERMRREEGGGREGLEPKSLCTTIGPNQ